MGAALLGRQNTTSASGNCTICPNPLYLHNKQDDVETFHETSLQRGSPKGYQKLHQGSCKVIES